MIGHLKLQYGKREAGSLTPAWHSLNVYIMGDVTKCQIFINRRILSMTNIYGEDYLKFFLLNKGNEEFYVGHGVSQSKIASVICVRVSSEGI